MPGGGGTTRQREVARSARARCWRLLLAAMTAGLFGLAPLAPVVASSTTPGTVFPVTAYGAQCNGTGNDYTAIQAALDAAAAGAGNTVMIPGGTTGAPAVCLVSGHLQMRGPNAVTLAGMTRDLSALRETGGTDLLGAKFDGSIVQDLTLDSRTLASSGTAFGSSANNTQLLRARTLGSPHHFSVYYTGLSVTQPATGNVVNDVIDVDQKCDDGFSYSFQTAGSITNLNETGTRLAIYEDSNITVTGMTYTPGRCAANGYFITAPSTNITVTGFTSSGSGGVVGGPDKRGESSNITINHEMLTNPSGFLLVKDVTGLLIENSSFGSSPENVVFAPRAGGTVGSYTSNTPTTVVDCNPTNASTVTVAGATCST